METKTHFQISIVQDFSTLIYEYLDTYVESIDIVEKGVDLPEGKPIYARVRYYTDELGYSEWSIVDLPFIIGPTANIVGICMVSTGGGSGQFKTIDWQGNFISDFVYTSHPIYSKLKQITIDGCIMMEVPTLYIKTDVSGPMGSDSVGKKCWWIADAPNLGFRPATAFKRDNTIKDKIWWGTYLANTETVRTKTCITSKYNKTVTASKTPTTFNTYALNRNSGGYTGFRLFDIWDMSLLKILLLIFGNGSNVQSIWGDNTAHNTYPKTGKTGSNALYMCDLWAHYWCILPNIKYDEDTRQLLLTDPLNSNTLTLDHNTSGRGWIVDICDGSFTIGTSTNEYENIHDLMELFIPSLTDGSESNSTFPDYCTIYTNSPYTWLSGGRGNDWYNAGLFTYDNSYWDGSGYSVIGCRLAKS